MDETYPSQVIRGIATLSVGVFLVEHLRASRMACSATSVSSEFSVARFLTPPRIFGVPNAFVPESPGSLRRGTRTAGRLAFTSKAHETERFDRNRALFLGNYTCPWLYRARTEIGWWAVPTLRERSAHVTVFADSFWKVWHFCEICTICRSRRMPVELRPSGARSCYESTKFTRFEFFEMPAGSLTCQVSR